MKRYYERKDGLFVECKENLDYYVYWIQTRERVRINKDTNKPKPWTEDPIFQQYKFCNVERENDRVTRWIFDNWYRQYPNHPNTWFAACVARLFNWPDTLEEIGFPQLDFLQDHKERWRRNLKGLRDEQGAKIFTGAYLVSTNGVKMDKIDYILDRVLTPIWINGVAPQPEETLEYYWEFLTQFDGLGSFMAGQVVADLKYYDPILHRASDWWDWAPLGPGSIRGLNRIHDRPTDKPLKQEQGLAEMQQLQRYVDSELGWYLPVHNLQNCCCETDKFLRVMNGEGKPRSLYPGVK